MRKAVAYIDSQVITELFKVPYNIRLIGMEYPTKDNKIKITLEGDNLPVKRSGPKTKRLPEVVYTILRHWHNAKIEPKTKESSNETQERTEVLSA